MIKSPILFAFFLSLLATPFIALIESSTASAANASNWQSGRIIDDAVFTDANSMSAAQVQDFLNQKVGTGGYGRIAGQCDTNGVGASESGGGTRAQYGAANGNPAPFTCLKDYYEVPKVTPSPGIPANNYGGKPIPAGARSAAQLIWDAAQQYNISPKVLLVTIQKESAGPLTTDDWPFEKQYTYAMGAHCPDSGPNGGANCDANYAGFSMQIRESARLFRDYLNGMYQPWWGCTENGVKVQCPSNRAGGSDPGGSYKVPGTTNFILWDVKPSGCGGGNIFITNKATAALYYYTPYQPNQAALNNLYGTGDGCSAYGNRNFWRIFTDWFGSTQTNTPYAWSVVGQESYGNPERTNPVNTSVLAPGQTVYVRVKARNAGYEAWKNTGDGAVRIGTNNPRERTSGVCTPAWLSCSRPGALLESSVAPGEIGTFEFPIKAQGGYGVTREHFSLLAEGKTWMNDQGMHWQLEVKPPTFVWAYEGQAAYADSAKTRSVNPGLLATSTNYHLVLRARNLGNAVWTNTGNNPINLGTSNPLDRQSMFCTATWLNCSRPASIKETAVQPGEVGTFEFQVTSPSSIGNFSEYFRPVVEGVGWMNDQGTHWQLNTRPPTYEWQEISQHLYTDPGRTSQISTGQSLSNGSIVYARVKAVNTGNATWSNSGINKVSLGTSNPKDRSSAFCDSSWLSCNRAATLKETSVAPGQEGTFEFSVKLPYSENGTIKREYFTPLSEGKTWMNDIGMYYEFKFSSPLNTWQYIGQGTYTNSSFTQPANTSSLARNTTYYLQLKAKNTSGATWNKSSLRLGTSNAQNRNSTFCNSTWLSCNRAATLKETSVAPGQEGTFEFSVTTPSTPGGYNEYFTPVIEGQTWLTDIGLFWQLTVL